MLFCFFGFKHITGAGHWSIMLASADMSWAKWAEQEELSWAGHSLVPQPTCCSFSKSDVDSVLASQEDLSWTLGRPGRPGQPVVIVNLLGSNARTCGDQLKYSEMSIDINSKRWCTCWLILGSMGRISVVRVVIFATLSINLQPKNSVLSSFLEKVSKRHGVHSVHL